VQQRNGDRRHARGGGQQAEEERDSAAFHIAGDQKQDGDEDEEADRTGDAAENSPPVAGNPAEERHPHPGDRRKRPGERENPGRALRPEAAEILGKLLADHRLDHVIKPEIDSAEEEERAVVRVAEHPAEAGKVQRDVPADRLQLPRQRQNGETEVT